MTENPFIETRKHHHLETAEDYTELVADLIEKKGEARTCEIAKEMGISHVTASKTIQRLQNEGFLKTSSHRPVHLTKKGEALAKYAKERHQVLLQFLKSLGVPDDIAAIDVEGMEHHISPATLQAIKKQL